MVIYAYIYDIDDELLGLIDMPMSTEDFLKKYGHDYVSIHWVCEYEYIIPMLEDQNDLEFASELSEYEPEYFLEEFYEYYPESKIYRMAELDEVLRIKGKKLSEILVTANEFSLGDDFFMFDMYGNIESLTTERAEMERECRITQMIYEQLCEERNLI